MTNTFHHHHQTAARAILSWLLAALIAGLLLDPVIRAIVFMIMKVYEYFVQGHVTV